MQHAAVEKQHGVCSSNRHCARHDRQQTVPGGYRVHMAKRRRGKGENSRPEGERGPRRLLSLTDARVQHLTMQQSQYNLSAQRAACRPTRETQRRRRACARSSATTRSEGASESMKCRYLQRYSRQRVSAPMTRSINETWSPLQCNMQHATCNVQHC